MERKDESILKRRFTRKSFLKGSTAAAVCVGAGGLGFNMTAFLAENNEQHTAGTEDKIYSCMCTASCLGSCRIMVHTRNGKIVKCEVGEQADPKLTRICVRGIAHVNQVNSPHRLKYPMKRVGKRGEGKWERISWEEAMDTIAKNLKSASDQYGSHSVIIGSSGGFTDFLNVFLSIRLTNIMEANSIDGCYDYSDTFGYGRLIGTNDSYFQGEFTQSIEDAKTIIIMSSNPPETRPHEWRFFLNAKEKGATLITIDPNYTRAADQSHIHVRPRLGSDPALVLAMCQHVIENGWINKDFLLKYTVAPFLVRQDTKAFLRMDDINPAEDSSDYVVWNGSQAGSAGTVTNPHLEGSFEINGIKVDTAYSLLTKHLQQYTPEAVQTLTNVEPEVIKKITRMFALEGPSSMFVGNYQYDNGDVLGHAYGVLAALTGNIGKRGNVIGHPGHTNDYMNPLPILFPYGFTKTANRIPITMLPQIIETGKFMGKNYPLKAMFLWGSNYLSQTTEQNNYRKNILEKMDFIATVDIWSTDTTEMSDIVLPAAHWFEQEGIAMADYNPVIAYTEKAAEPAFESRPDKDIIRDLATRLGYGKDFEPSNEDFYSQMLMGMANVDGVDLPKLKEKKIVASKPQGWSPSRNWVSAKGAAFPTPSKRMEFYLEAPKPRLDVGLPYSPDKERLPEWRPPFEAWPDNPLFEKYPLVGLSERVRWRFHSGWHDNPWLRELDPEPVVKMNPEDAALRGIKENDTVEVYNDRGHFVLKAIINNGLQKGNICLPKGWQRYQCIAGSAQELTKNIVNTSHYGQAFFDVLCEVRKYKGGAL